MLNPRVEINLDKVRHNTSCIVKICADKGISVMGVTKVFCAQKDIAIAMKEGGVKYLADSRLENIIKMSDIEIPKVLLRLPMMSELGEVVRYSDFSLNSEVYTIRRLSDEAIKQNRKHGVILMVDLGDLREGVWYENALDTAGEIIGLNGIELAGIGTNLTCYGGVIPSRENLSILATIANDIRKKYSIKLPIVSGGNSSSLYLVENGDMPEGINNLRIGEAIVLGRETAYGRKVKGLYEDAFVLYGEIVEIKKKPTLPVGNIGMDAFGRKPEFIDRGLRYRAIVAMGRQDIDFRSTVPVEKGVEVVGASSDHLIIDITDSGKKYTIGDEVAFKMAYGCLLQSMTSPYVKKKVG